MPMRSKMQSVFLGVALAIVAGATNAAAQAYPTKPVTFVVPFGAGGAVDVVARVLGEGLSKKLGQQIVVDNRPGATGNIAIDYVARSAPDGYRLLFSNAIPLVVNPVLTENFPVVVSDAFAPISLVGDSSSYILAVNAKVPVGSVQELVAYTKANAGKINYASGGNGSINQLAMELFKTSTGADLTHIPYQAGAAAAVTAVLGNEAQVMVGSISSIAPHVQSGALRAIAVTGEARSPEMPNVPTMKEAGLKDYNFTVWYGLLAPKGTPAEAVAAMNAAVNAVLQDPAVKAGFAKQGVDPKGSTSAAFAKLISDEGAVWKEVAKKANLLGK